MENKRSAQSNLNTTHSAVTVEHTESFDDLIDLIFSSVLTPPLFLSLPSSDASVKQTIVEDYGSTCPQGYKRFNSTHCQGRRTSATWNTGDP